jgi:hypothetical protein
MRRMTALLFVFAIGCSSSKPDSHSPRVQREGSQVAPKADDDIAKPAEFDSAQRAERANFLAFHQATDDKPQMNLGPVAAKQPAAEPPAKRRIIYSASIDLIVTDFDGGGKNLQRIVDDHGGYIARADVGETSGERRHATWTLRIPIAKFREAMDALAQLGHAVSTKHDSQDVTDEFYDLEARLKNKRVEEERLLDHLKKSTGKLDDILAVEKELSRVRGEIEATQGRLQKLAKLSELTTIVVSMHEQKDYVPPTAPTYKSSVGQTFGDSVNALVSLFKGIGLALAALVPWSPFILVAAGVILLMVRRSRREPAAQP